jgi:hypothetical protein
MDDKWIIPILVIMSLTLALSEREQNVLTHASPANILFVLDETVSNARLFSNSLA